MKIIKNESDRVTNVTLKDVIHVSKNSLEYKVCLLFLEDLVKSGRIYGNLKDAYFYHEAILKIFFDDNFIEFYSQKDENGDYKYKEIGFDININDVEEIYLYSDGYSSIFTTFDIYKDYIDAFKNDIDVKTEIAKIVEVAYKDKHTDKYPRFKTIDDISLLKARFDNIE